MLFFFKFLFQLSYDVLEAGMHKKQYGILKIKASFIFYPILVFI